MYWIELLLKIRLDPREDIGRELLMCWDGEGSRARRGSIPARRRAIQPPLRRARALMSLGWRPKEAPIARQLARRA